MVAHGRPLAEATDPGVHLLELGDGLTAETSPVVAGEVHVARVDVRVMHRLLGERFPVVRGLGRG